MKGRLALTGAMAGAALLLAACGDAADVNMAGAAAGPADSGALDTADTGAAGGGGPPPVTPGVFIGAAAAETEGEALFIEKCAMCHREVDRVAGMGTFLIARRDPANDPLLEHRDFLTPDYVLAAVRNGIGNMPRISRADASDAEVALIADYMIATAQDAQNAESAQDAQGARAQGVNGEAEQ